MKTLVAHDEFGEGVYRNERGELVDPRGNILRPRRSHVPIVSEKEESLVTGQLSKRELRIVAKEFFKGFLKTPSAINYRNLERSLLAYQKRTYPDDGGNER